MYNIFCIGDSVTFGIGGDSTKVIGWCDQLKFNLQHRVWNLGISGDTSQGILKRINEAIVRTKPSRKNIFIIAVGLNDLAFDGQSYEVNPSKYAENITQICNFYKQYGQVIILESTLISSKIGNKKDKYGNFRKISDLLDYNQILENISAENKFEFIKFLDFGLNFVGDDGLHPNQLGYNYMAEIIEQKLNFPN